MDVDYDLVDSLGRAVWVPDIKVKGLHGVHLHQIEPEPELRQGRVRTLLLVEGTDHTDSTLAFCFLDSQFSS